LHSPVTSATSVPTTSVPAASSSAHLLFLGSIYLKTVLLVQNIELAIKSKMNLEAQGAGSKYACCQKSVVKQDNQLLK